ncbi:TetR family transcriptional regulator [Azospirillum brasilense]|uniref:TetR family transcriptional regulator n=2 Tax=Azospirillum brasilense TaxID=192 RepID=A0A235H720_AZOBR|nr:TetR family transcriptional regulator [Azospirillum brasilense]
MTESSPIKARVGRLSKEDAAETSDRIIDTAAQLFAAQGFAATSIEQVASACSAGKDTIYRRFPSKAALFAAVVERMRTRTLDGLEAEIDSAGGDALSRLKRVARWFLAVNLEPDVIALNRIALSEAILLGEDRRDQWESDPITDRLVALVAAAQWDGMLGGDDPRVIAAHLLHSIVFGPLNDAMLGRATYASTAVQDRFFDQAWTLFLRGAGRSLPAGAR